MTAIPNRLPRARVSGLIMSHQDDTVLIYDTLTHHIHHLNPEMALIWRSCDGEHTLATLSTATALPVSQVQLALSRLAQANLFDAPLDPGIAVSGQTRRRFLKQAGAVGVAIPAIVSITAPTAAQSTSSCGQAFDSCSLDADCCSGQCDKFRCSGYAGCAVRGSFCITGSPCCSGTCFLNTCI